MYVPYIHIKNPPANSLVWSSLTLAPITSSTCAPYKKCSIIHLWVLTRSCTCNYFIAIFDLVRNDQTLQETILLITSHSIKCTCVYVHCLVRMESPCRQGHRPGVDWLCTRTLPEWILSLSTTSASGSDICYLAESHLTKPW